MSDGRRECFVVNADLTTSIARPRDLVATHLSSHALTVLALLHHLAGRVLTETFAVRSSVIAFAHRVVKDLWSFAISLPTITAVHQSLSQSQALTPYCQSWRENVSRINNPDAVYDLWIEAPSLWLSEGEETPVVESNSELGLFVRSCHAAFRAASFQQTSAAVTAFLEFLGHAAIAADTEAMAIVDNTATNENTNESKPSSPLADFLASLQSLDYGASLSHVHRFCDLCVGAGTIDGRLAATRAALNRAAMELAFGHRELAREIAGESSRLAQQLRDKHSLQLAMSIIHDDDDIHSHSGGSGDSYQSLVSHIDAWKASGGSGSPFASTNANNPSFNLTDAQSSVQQLLSQTRSELTGMMANDRPVNPVRAFASLNAASVIATATEQSSMVDEINAVKRSAWRGFGARELVSALEANEEEKELINDDIDVAKQFEDAMRRGDTRTARLLRPLICQSAASALPSGGIEATEAQLKVARLLLAQSRDQVAAVDQMESIARHAREHFNPHQSVRYRAAAIDSVLDSASTGYHRHCETATGAASPFLRSACALPSIIEALDTTHRLQADTSTALLRATLGSVVSELGAPQLAVRHLHRAVPILAENGTEAQLQRTFDRLKEIEAREITGASYVVPSA